MPRAEITLADVDRRLEEVQKILQNHIVEEEKMLLAAFPQGDFVAHRLAHEQMAAAAAAQEKFWNDLRTELARKGIFFLLAVLGGLILLGVTVKLGIPAAFSTR